MNTHMNKNCDYRSLLFTVDKHSGKRRRGRSKYIDRDRYSGVAERKNTECITYNVLYTIRSTQNILTKQKQEIGTCIVLILLFYSWVISNVPMENRPCIF